MAFSFATASKIHFGEGVARQAPEAAVAFGKRVLVVTGANPDRHAWFAEALAGLGAASEFQAISDEPDIAVTLAGVEKAADLKADVVVGLGGGSALDAAKAIAALAANPGDPLRFLEVVGEGKPLEAKPLPCIAIPTTAGTGSEVTRNAVLSVPEHKRKVSLRDDRMLPDIAFVDPELTYSLTKAVTAATGLDALTQCVEPYLSAKATPMTDCLSREGIIRAARALPRVLTDPGDKQARHDLMLASLFGGLSLANGGLGAVHGFAGVIGGWTGAAHGAICGRLLPGVLKTNADALADLDQPNRMAEVAHLLGANDLPSAIQGLESLLETGGVPRLKEMGLAEADLPTVAEASKASSSMKGNPVALSQDQAVAALTYAF